MIQINFLSFLVLFNRKIYMQPNFLDQLSSATGLQQDLLKTVLILILNIFISPLFRIIPSPSVKLAYSLIIGFTYTVYLVEEWSMYVLTGAIIPYLVFILLRKNRLIIVCIFGFFYLLFIHVYRYMYDYMVWRIDCSTIAMFMVTKITYYALFLQSTKTKPQLFSYLSYCYFFPGVLIGPTFSYETFKKFIESRNKQIPVTPIFKRLLVTIILIVCTIKILSIFDPYWCLRNEWYLSLPSWAQLLSLNIIGFCYRIKFYVAWGLAQSSIDLSSISWDQQNKQYSKVIAGSIRFQTQLSPKNKTQYWNTEVQKWLKFVVYDTLAKYFKSSTIATYGTFLVSAFWHGIYLTYYLGFMQWAIIIVITKWAYKCSLAVPKLANNLIVKALAFLVASTMLNYTGMFLVVLTWNQAVQFYSNMNYIGNVLMAVLLVMSFTVKPKMLQRMMGSKSIK